MVLFILILSLKSLWPFTPRINIWLEFIIFHILNLFFLEDRGEENLVSYGISIRNKTNLFVSFFKGNMNHTLICVMNLVTFLGILFCFLGILFSFLQILFCFLQISFCFHESRFVLKVLMVLTRKLFCFVL